MSDFSRKIREALKDFAEKLENKEEIEATQVVREETPDGPLHTFQKIRLEQGPS